MNFDEVPGWIKPIDQLSFKWVLEYQNACEPIGGVVELGVFKGKSAIVIGRCIKSNERFTVCDLFENVSTYHEIHPSIKKLYKYLNQKDFEKNYLEFLPILPTSVNGPSSSIVKNVKPGTCRFMHIDVSHMYEHVSKDIASAKLLLRLKGEWLLTSIAPSIRRGLRLLFGKLLSMRLAADFSHCRQTLSLLGRPFDVAGRDYSKCQHGADVEDIVRRSYPGHDYCPAV